jgi:hypothetical protein
MDEDGVGRIWLPRPWERSLGWPRGHGKTKVTLDIMHGKERTMTGKIASPVLVAQHLRVTFCTNEWLMEHVDSRINEMVVKYQSAEQVIRPPTPTDVSVCKDIMS